MELFRVLPKGSCPTCGHSQFIVVESQLDSYLTNSGGEIIDHKEERHVCVGKCVNCGNTFEMYPTNNGFIPLTKLKKLLYDYIYNEEIQDKELQSNIDNPFLLGDGK